MATKIEKEDIARRAGEANMLLNHSMLKEAFDVVEIAAIAAMKAHTFGPDEAEEERKALILTLQVVDQVKEQLYGYINEANITNAVKPEEF